MKRFLLVIFAFLIIASIVAGYFFLHYGGMDAHTKYVWQWIRHPEKHADWANQAKTRCGEAPFILPTSGFIGYLWEDSFKVGERHQGIDIFGGTNPGITPVYAAYDGYLTRQADWKSTLIIRIPSDPLHLVAPSSGAQIWTYYTHLADENGISFIVPDFPPGTTEVFVEAGTLLGYQGNFSGNPGNPVGVHLHFSIVRDSGGKYLNELEIGNTLDPSPYLGMGLNSKDGGVVPVDCLP